MSYERFSRGQVPADVSGGTCGDAQDYHVHKTLNVKVKKVGISLSVEGNQTRGQLHIIYENIIQSKIYIDYFHDTQPRDNQVPSFED